MATRYVTNYEYELINSHISVMGILQTTKHVLETYQAYLGVKPKMSCSRTLISIIYAQFLKYHQN